MSMTIRTANANDEQALFDICLKTARSGEDASALFKDPRLPGFVWSVPYLHADPTLVFLAEDEAGVCGYIVGTPDSVAHDNWLQAEWYPSVRSEFASYVPTTEQEIFSLSRINAALQLAPDHFTPYPAHLHINLLPRAQSGGWGRALIEALMDELTNRQVRGLHLGVNPTNHRAIGFYKHMGFVDLKIPGGVTMGRPL